MTFVLRRRRMPVLLQCEAAECGLACLAMIASAHGHSLDLNEVRHRFRVSMKGTTLKDIVGFAKSLGMSARALRLEPEALGRLQCPAILHMDMNHFVVLREMRGRDALVHDPAIGFRRLGPRQLERRFTGIALELSPGPDFAPKRPRPRLRIATLTGGLPQSAGIAVKALLLSLAVQMLVLAAPFFVQLSVDRAVALGDAEPLAALTAGFALVIMLRAGVGWLRAKVLLAFGGLLNARLVTNLVRHMLRLPNAWFENRSVSALLSRVSSTQPIRDLVAEGLVAAIVDGAMALLTITVALFFAPALALVVLAGFAGNTAVKVWQVRRSMDREHEHIEAFAKAQQELIETIRGIAAVKLFNKEADRERRWADRHIETINARHALDSVKARADVARDALQGLVLAAIVYLGATQVVSGAITLGALMAFITYQQIFSDASARLLDFAGRFRLLDVHLQRLADVVEEETEKDNAIALPGGAALGGAIAAVDLGFRYGEAERDVLDGVSLDIAAGEFVAITGPSGGGKTTFLKLLVGLLPPRKGMILYDGRPLQSLGVAAVREGIGVVMQDDVLLSGSIAQNISFFDQRPDMEWIRTCARRAAIDPDINAMPMGYHTLVGDMGTTLSGGQKQRVLLARALYRRPAILFMDEGTSSLDSDKEHEVNANLRDLSMTRVVIAHRKDTIDAADRTLELGPDGFRERPKASS